MGTTRARKNNRLAAALAMGLLALSSISCGKDSDQNLAPSPTDSTKISPTEIANLPSSPTPAIYGDPAITAYDTAKSNYTLDIDATAPVHGISDMLYGIFIEDINFAADGGLYAELVQNRSFEFKRISECK